MENCLLNNYFAIVSLGSYFNKSVAVLGNYKLLFTA